MEAEPLEVIQARAMECRGCSLCEGRTNLVFGEGSPDARVMIIGEAPGRNEDEQGRPFVGAAGKNLDEMLSIAGLRREDVYIANVLKCRPPGNRNPLPEEIEQCADFLRAQTKSIMPEYIVTMGNFATKFILRTEVGITRLRGDVHMAGKFKVFPVFHPAAAIYDRSKMDTLRQDFEKLGNLLRGNQ